MGRFCPIAAIRRLAYTSPMPSLSDTYEIQHDFRQDERLRRAIEGDNLDAEFLAIRNATANLIEYLELVTDGEALRSGVLRPETYEHVDGPVPIAYTTKAGVTYPRYAVLSDQSGYGTLGFTPRGAWTYSSSIFYAGNDLVTESAKFYLCRGAGHTPTAYADFASALADNQWVEFRPVGRTYRVRKFVATEGQTALQQLDYPPSGMLVFVNGVKLDASATGSVLAFDGVNIEFSSPLNEGDVVEVMTFSRPDIANEGNRAPLLLSASGSVAAGGEQFLGAFNVQPAADNGGQFIRLFGVSLADDSGDVSSDYTIEIRVNGTVVFSQESAAVGSEVDDPGPFVAVAANLTEAEYATAVSLVEVVMKNASGAPVTLHGSVCLTIT